MTNNRGRRAGILLPIFSLPSPYGIGCFSSEAYRFADWLAEAGQTDWQILPLGMTGYGDSPYQSFSAFAGNPYFISLEGLIQDGYLTRAECDAADLTGETAERVDYGRQYAHRYPLLRRAYARYCRRPLEEMAAWSDENRDWLEDFALFIAIKESYGGKPPQHWSRSLRLRCPEALAEAKRTLADAVGFHCFLQARFDREWRSLKQYANQKGICVVGDLPIYVSADSADVWANPQLFCLDEDRIPTAVAGCPPDGFAPNGQLWGNPLYRWEAHAADGYRWWIRRLAHAFSLYDAVRIDHFRGFESYYAIPNDGASAAEGDWQKGPGMALFGAVAQAIGKQDGIAEDLGFITDAVRCLVKESGFASTKVLQIGLEACETDGDNEHLPHRYERHCAAYTGTHDHPTLLAWLKHCTPRQEAFLRAYVQDAVAPPSVLCEKLIASLMQSSAERCIIPMQDYLGLAEEGRINRPSSAEGNWQWRMPPHALTQELCEKVRRLTEQGDRLP